MAAANDAELPPPGPGRRLAKPMLFDLRGRGRRRTVKIVYVTLAFLMGGGLVLFGIGGGGAVSGGLVDALTGGSGGGDTGTERFVKSERAAAAHRGEPAGRRGLGRARPRARADRGSRRELRSEHEHLHRGGQGQAHVGRPRRGTATSRSSPRSPTTASRSLMVRAYDQTALNRPADAVEGAGDHHRGTPEVGHLRHARLSTPTSPARRRKGDLARQQALDLAEPDETQHAQEPARPGQAAVGAQPGPAGRGAGARRPRRRRRRSSRPAGRARRPRLNCGDRALVAQLAEQRTLNPKVPGSIPGGGTTKGLHAQAFRRSGRAQLDRTTVSRNEPIPGPGGRVSD